MLRLITSGALSSALTARLADEFLAVRATLGSEVLPLLRGLRPWNEMLEGVRWFFWMEEKVGVNRAEEAAAMVPAQYVLRLRNSQRRRIDLGGDDFREVV